MSNPANVQNHLTGLSYDIAGNVLNDPLGNAATYDAASRIVSDAGYTYSYDADGLRIKKANGAPKPNFGQTLTSLIPHGDLRMTASRAVLCDMDWTPIDFRRVPLDFLA